MNKKLNTETTADDLLMLPDIDGIVKDIKGQKTVSGQSKDDNKDQKSEDSPTDTDTTASTGGGSSWEVFLKCSQSYDYRVRNDDRRVYPIDNDIINTLKQCDINRMSTATMINSILRAFIEQNKERLREHKSMGRSLI
ncbi:MAG: lipase [Prevotella sp.]|nr:lipase [Prevotella sp.]